MASGSSEGEGSDIRWDTAFRRDLRQELRENLLETQRTREVMSNPDVLLKQLEEGDKLYDRVTLPREAAIDSKHFKLLSEIARCQSQGSRGELVHFNEQVYCEKLLSLMGGGLDSPPDWTVLGKLFIKSFKVAPTTQV
uniref:Uncharacterized protein n=1 Tax=Amphimedon queenslandica TaxID=400682 RepID=A0A1X7TD95_AMPQE